MHPHVITQITIICKLLYKVKQTLFPELILPAQKKLDDKFPSTLEDP